MSMEHRQEALRRKHAAIEASLSEEKKHPWHDETEIRRLKVQKLHLKEELSRAERG